MPKKSGFTLIELLVVVSIIAILMAIGIANYATILNNARDAKRKSDLKFIQSALEQYHADGKYYPQSLTPGSPLTFGSGSNVKTYLKEVPKDPLPTPAPQYSYVALPNTPSACDNSATSTNKCTGYCIYAKMENNDNRVDSSFCTDSSSYNYEVTSP